jgi:hypothetical protein
VKATAILPASKDKLENIPEIQPGNEPEKVISLEDFLVKPAERMEWVDGKLEEKTGITFKHGLAQSKLSTS